MGPALETFSSNNHDEDRNLSLVTPLKALCLLCCYCHIWGVSKEFYFPMQKTHTSNTASPRTGRDSTLLVSAMKSQDHYQHSMFH